MNQPISTQQLTSPRMLHFGKVAPSPEESYSPNCGSLNNWFAWPTLCMWKPSLDNTFVNGVPCCTSWAKTTSQFVLYQVAKSGNSRSIWLQPSHLHTWFFGLPWKITSIHLMPSPVCTKSGYEKNELLANQVDSKMPRAKTTRSVTEYNVSGKAPPPLQHSGTSCQVLKPSGQTKATGNSQKRFSFFIYCF